MLVHGFHRTRRNFRGGPDIAPQRFALPVCGRHAAIANNACEAAHGVCPAAETEQENAVARLPEAHDGRVTVDDVPRDSEAGGSADEIIDVPIDALRRASARLQCAEARIVKGYLSVGIDV